MADVYVNALTTISDEPTTTDSIVCVNRNTNEGQIIDYSLLADKILEKLSSKTFSSLTTSSKLVPGAINELDSDVTSLNSSVSTAGSNASTALAKVQHGYQLSTTGSGVDSTTLEALYTQLYGLVGTQTGVTSFTANISGQVFGGMALITSASYGSMLLYNYGGTLRLCSRNNSTTWTIKSASWN